MFTFNAKLGERCFKFEWTLFCLLFKRKKFIHSIILNIIWLISFLLDFLKKNKINPKYSFLFPVILESLKKIKITSSWAIRKRGPVGEKTLERETHDIVKFMILKNIACINHGQLNLMIYMYLSLVILRCISEIVYFFLLRRCLIVLPFFKKAYL